MTQEELENKYLKIPQDIKQTRRWICYRVEVREDKKTKVPYNAINGSWAKSNDPTTWTSFRIAVMGCIKYHFDGIGFMLGDGYFGIDLDNHEDANGNKPMTSDEFYDFSTEFVNALQSYTEFSHSGEGIHIICKGTLPKGARRKNGVAVEMYDKARFFTMTGNVINNLPINERTEEVKPLWEKYLNTSTTNEEVEDNFNGIVFGSNRYAKTIEISHSNLSDSDLIEKIRSSRYGSEFNALYNGDMSAYGNDHSSADMALCKILAFWTGCDRVQMDRIFRSSALIREKWDKKRGDDTYGQITIDKAIISQHEVYTPAKEKVVFVKSVKNAPIESQSEIVQFDERNDPIVNVKQIFKNYSLDDTGNAERFYDYFGEYFKYNKQNQYFMFWNGKTWTNDIKGNVRKFANKLIEVLRRDALNTDKNIEELKKKGEEGASEVKELQGVLKAQLENIKRISNKAGKDAMLSELHELHDLPVINDEFDTQDYLLNTDSGVVDLKTGDIKPFDRKYMLSKNTNCKVSFEKPIVWLKFLNDIFERGNPDETQEIIDTIQMALGESLTGRTNKEHLFILHGQGSNGKSTFIKTVNEAFGDYGTSMNSEMLIQNPNSSAQSNEFSMSSLLGARMVSTSETAEGKRLDEVMIKQMLSGEKINAQFKYGKPFSFLPTFSPWMSTNNKPVIRATDFGTWRRIFFVPFLNKFTDDKKDVDMPKKLAKEMPQILGWMIQGSVKLCNQYNNKLPQPKCLEEALSDYKKELDVIIAFINDRCIPFPEMEIEAPLLYQAYKEWAKQNGEWCYSESKFKLEMPKKGYPIRKDINKGYVYCGLKLATNRSVGIKFGEQ